MSFILAAGGTSNSVNMTAAGSIAAGQPVIVTAAGTAAQVGVTGTGTDYTVVNNLTGPGSGYSVFGQLSGSGLYLAANSQNVILGTYTGSGPTWGTPYQYSASAATLRAVFPLSASTFAVCYFAPTTNYPTIIVGSVTGGVITFGTPATVSANAFTLGSFAPAGSNALIGLFWNNGAATVRTFAATVSGTTVSVGAVTAQPVNAAGTAGNNNLYGGCVFHVAQSKGYFAWTWLGAPNGCEYIVGTLSGNTLAYGSTTTYATAVAPIQLYLYDPLRAQIIWEQGFSFNILSANIIGTSFSPISLIASGGTSPQISYDTKANLIVENYSTGFRSITNSGSALTGNTPTATSLNSASAFYYDSVIGQFYGGSSTTLGIAKLGTTNLGTGNYLGIATNAASVGGTVTVNTVGNTATIAGLTPGSNYAVLSTGGLAPTSTLTLGQYAGVAVSNTTLLLKG